jgi:hypothetical protein
MNAPSASQWVAATGTRAVMLVVLGHTVANAPLNVSVVGRCVDPKLAPVIVTYVPTTPEVC